MYFCTYCLICFLAALEVCIFQEVINFGSLCPNVPPVVHLFCGDLADEYDCILQAWVCDGIVNCRSGLDEHAATCAGANPCEGVQCPPYQICESYPYVIGVTVSFHRCVPCPDGFTGVTCQEAITQSMSPTTSLTTSPTTTIMDPTLSTTSEPSVTTAPLTTSPPVTSDPPLLEPDQTICSTRPCMNGVCTPLRDGRHCSCRPGFSGDACEIAVNPCASLPCRNRGRCQIVEDNFRCDCLSGYTGRRCESLLRGCDGITCSNRGRCVVFNDAYQCLCDNRYTGLQCESQVDPCSQLLCFYGGQCRVDDNDEAYCACPQFRAGRRCERQQLCVGNREDTCMNNGVCVPEGGPELDLTSCTCLPGYTGVQCETNIDDCAGITCGNRGQCIDEITTYTCDCDMGFTGPTCETEINPCLSEPCGSSGYCCWRGDRLCDANISPMEYLCYCFDGYTGDDCQSTPSPCSSNPCMNDGFCTQYGDSSYQCTCPLTYNGINCEISTPCASAPCLFEGACVPLPDGVISDQGNTYRCDCDDNHFGTFCESSFPCSESPCENEAQCIDKAGGEFECICSDQYEGTLCEVYLSCSTSPCHRESTCLELRPGYTCLCSHTYTGQHCQTYMPCSVAPCGQYGVCFDAVNSDLTELGEFEFVCQCSSNYTGDRCEQYLPCVDQPCLFDGECVEVSGSYVCTCAMGYTGQNCETFMACSSAPCINDGQCLNVDGGYDCDCPASHSGTMCELYLTCSSDPCGNGGQCIPTVDDYRCNCLPAYTGDHCESIRACSEEPCVHGTCIEDAANSFRCICSSGSYTGQLCDVPIQCYPNPCLSGGSCSISNDGISYQCMCVNPYYGHRCQFREACASDPCMNGGDCSAVEPQGYTCDCTPAFTGPQCGTYVACYVQPCQNNGQCVLNSQGVYECDCPSGYGGVDCTIPLPCASEPCLNEGRCVTQGQIYECQCGDHYTGTHCEEETPCAQFDCNYGFCVSVNSIVSCTCNSGYTSVLCDSLLYCDQTTCTNGQCAVTPDATPFCVCNPGFGGISCDRASQPCDDLPCLNSGTCINLSTTYQCECTASYTGRQCESQVLPCVSEPCLNDGTCTNLNGGFICTCIPPYSGDFCELGTCASDPCMNFGRCIEKRNGFVCICRSLWIGDTCDFRVESCTPSPCENTGDCQMDEFGPFCMCIDGYQGVFCDRDAGLCEAESCQNNGLCWPISDTDIACECLPGYRGEFCQDLDVIIRCNPELCVEGDCEEDARGQYHCVCSPGYIGTHCDIHDPCYLTECSGNAVCVVEGTFSRCVCPPDRTGPLCETILGACHTNPCGLHSSSCEDGGSTNMDDVICTCEAGYTGFLCDYEIDECDGNTACGENGVCEDLLGEFRCVCDDGYYGDFCAGVDSCYTQPCAGGATCLTLESPIYFTPYTCVCPRLFVGPVCAQYDYCTAQLQPCMNFGLCHNERDQARCECVGGFGGTFCQIRIVDCIDPTCSNHGTCTDPGNTGLYRCECDPGYSGESCQNTPCSDGETSSVCANGGICMVDMDYPSGLVCVCGPGWFGVTCQQSVLSLNPGFSGLSALTLVPPVRTTSSTTISLTIYPLSTEGLILYCSQSEHSGDFIALGLDQQQLKLRINLGSGLFILEGPLLLQARWQSVFITIRGTSVTMLVNNDLISGVIPGSSNQLTLDTPLYVGGTSLLDGIVVHPNLGFTQGYTGCIQELRYGTTRAVLLSWFDTQTTKHVTSCSQSQCSISPCVGTSSVCILDISDGAGSARTCLCEYGRIGDSCENVHVLGSFPSFSGSGFISLNDLLGPGEAIQMEIIFKPQRSSGIILYNHLQGNFLAITLVGGRVQLTFDTGSGAAFTRAVLPLTLERWHHIAFNITGTQGTLQLNFGTISTCTVPGSDSLSTNQITYLAGVDPKVDIREQVISAQTNGLTGCLQSILSNGARVHWSSIATGLAVEDCIVATCANHQCVEGSTCIPSLANDGTYTCLCGPGTTGTYCQFDMCEILDVDDQCINGGACRIDQSGVSYCQCPMPYTGTLCADTLSFTFPQLRGESYLFYRHSVFPGLRELAFGIQVTFRTQTPDGVILWIGEAADDWIAIRVINGVVHVLVYKFDGTTHLLVNDVSDIPERVDTFQWNTIQLTTERDPQQVNLELVINYSSTFTTTQLINTDIDFSEVSGIYIGGTPPTVTPLLSNPAVGLTGCVVQLRSRLFDSNWANMPIQGAASGGWDIQTCVLIS